MATSKGTMFDPTLVKDLITKVKGKSALAALCSQTPIPFNGLKEMIFLWTMKLILSQRMERKPEGSIAIAPVKVYRLSLNMVQESLIVLLFLQKKSSWIF